MKKRKKDRAFVSIKKTDENILLVVFHHPHPTDHQFDGYLSKLKDEYLSFDEPFVVIFDSRKVKYLPAPLRKKQAEWMKENDELLVKNLKLTIYVINNPVIRLILEAIFLIQKSPIPFVIVRDLPAAEKKASEHMKTT